MVVMSDSDAVQLNIRVPRELMERLKAMAEAEDRPLASVVRRLLTKASEVGRGVVVVDEKGNRAAGQALQVKGRREVPIGGQDAASGAGVEARQEETTIAPVRREDEPESAVLAAVKGTTRERPADTVVIGGAACTHPQAHKLGRLCNAPGCGKAVYG